MRDTAGRVVEGTMTNLFLVRDGELTTPPVDRCGVAGVMRGLVLDMAHRLGIPAHVREIQPPDLQGADAVFLTNSLVGIWPVRELQGWHYDVEAVPPRLRDTVRDNGFRVDDADGGWC